MQIRQDLLTSRNRPRVKLHPKYIVIHWTANTGKGANAQANRNYFQNTDRWCSAHYLVDSTEIVQAVPDNEVAYHVGGKTYRHAECRNTNSIGIEMCVNSDGNFQKMEQRTVELVAHLCQLHKIDPDRFLIRHYDVTGKDCPRFYVQDKTAWGRFKQMVKAKMKGDEDMQPFIEKERANTLILWLKDEYKEADKAGNVQEKKYIGEIADILRVVSGQLPQNGGK